MLGLSVGSTQVILRANNTYNYNTKKKIVM